MAGAHTLTFTDDNFETDVIGADAPVLVDFWAQWCMPCRALGPTIDALAEEYAGRAKVGKVDTDSNQSLAARYGISAIPTVMFFKDGQAVETKVGLASAADLKAVLDRLL